MRRDTVQDAGGFPSSSASFGTYGNAGVIDNSVAGVHAIATDTFPLAST